MSKDLDRLFREKLADHKVVPSEAAWSKVEASLTKEKKGIVWFRAAAALVLLGLLTTTILWVRSGEETGPAMAKVDSVKKTPKPRVMMPTPKKVQKSTEPKLPVMKSSSSKTKVYIAQEETKKEMEQPVQQQEVVSETPLLVAQQEPQLVAQQEQPLVKTTKSSITLTYTLGPIPSQERAVAAAEEKKGLQKVVSAARDAKNSEGVLTELRLMKDDLFALNFKKK